MNETLRQLDEQQQVAAREGPEAPEAAATQRGVQRSWTHYGGMVPQQESANIWIKQNHEIRKMAANDRDGTGRDQENTQSSERPQNEAELQEAREIAQEAREREAAQQRERQQERGR